MRGAVSLCAWAALLAGCSSSGGSSPQCVSLAGLDCANAVNAVVLPMLVDDGVAARVTSDTELCRRYAVDLAGAIPSWDEIQAHCAGKTPEEMVTWFMSQPAYVAVNQRAWADLFQYDNHTVWYAYIEDVDAAVAKLYRGELLYPDFAAIAAAHPAMVGEFAGENVVAYAFQAFLGRDALPEERQDLLALYRMWRTRGAYDPALTRFRYNACTSDADCATGRTCIDQVCQATTNYREIYIDPRACAGALGAIACTSHGITPKIVGDAPIALAQLTDEQWTELRAPGRVIASLPPFWEAAVDAVLKKYLGWWHGGYEIPGYEIAQVRRALAEAFRASRGDVRALEREVLVSAPYVMPADETAGDTKWWHRGPTKQMTAETWLDSVAKVAGTDLGRCDWRFPNLTPRWLPPALVPAKGALRGLDYAHEARVMGGCPDQVSGFRYTDVGILAAMEQRTVLAAVCGDPGAQAFLPAPGASATDLVTGLYHDILSAEPGEEGAALAAALPAADAPVARNLCQALMRSGRFLFY